MPRTLPWLNGGGKKTDTKSSSPAHKRQKREHNPADLVDADLNDPTTPPPRPKQKKRPDRTPSTSPAPAPPEVEYMRPGYGADDIYMMVEDEFCAVAKAFTRHIHHAEYARLKKLAGSRGGRAGGHGTDGRTERSRGLQVRMEQEAGGRRRVDFLGAEGAESEDGEEEEKEDPYMRDPQLAGLMMKDRGVFGRELGGMVKAKSKTRAAAGFSQSPYAAKRYRDAVKEEEVSEVEGAARAKQKPRKASSGQMSRMFEEVSDDEDDDLDAAPARPASRRPETKQRPTLETQYGDESAQRFLDDGGRGSIFARFAKPVKDRSPGSKAAATNAPSSPPGEFEHDESHGGLRAKSLRPTYKKALNRQKASQAMRKEDEAAARRLPTHPSSRTWGADGVVPPTSAPPNQPASATCAYSNARPMPTNTVPSSADRGTTATSTGHLGSSPDKHDAPAPAAAYLAKRMAERARREKAPRGRTTGVDDIPTFLF